MWTKILTLTAALLINFGRCGKTDSTEQQEQEQEYTIEQGKVEVNIGNYRTNLFWKKFKPNNQTNKPLVILCPGGPNASHKYITPLAHMIVRLGYPVLTFDPRGCGESDIASVEFGLINMGFDLLNLIEKLTKTDEELILMGHSAGGLFVFYFICQIADQYFKNRLLGSVLLNSAPIYEAGREAVKGYVESLPLSRRDPLLGISLYLQNKNFFFGSSRFMNAVLNKADEVFVQDPRRYRVGVFGSGAEMIDREKYLAFARYYNYGMVQYALDILEKRIEEALVGKPVRTLTKPIICVGSTQDIIPIGVFHENNRKIQALSLSEVREEMLEADHTPWLSNPEQLQDTLERVLTELSDQGKPKSENSSPSSGSASTKTP